MSVWCVNAIGLVVLGVAGIAGAQSGPVVDPQHFLSYGADARLEAATLRAWYAALGERLREGRQGSAATEALARAQGLVPAKGNFETMRARDAIAMVDAHDALVAALALPPSERIACVREPLVGSHIPVVTCRVAGDDLATAERDRIAMRQGFDG